jgi:hypothetical protein
MGVFVSAYQPSGRCRDVDIISVFRSVYSGLQHLECHYPRVSISFAFGLHVPLRGVACNMLA